MTISPLQPLEGTHKLTYAAEVTLLYKGLGGNSQVLSHPWLPSIVFYWLLKVPAE